MCSTGLQRIGMGAREKSGDSQQSEWEPGSQRQKNKALCSAALQSVGVGRLSVWLCWPHGRNSLCSTTISRSCGIGVRLSKMGGLRSVVTGIGYGCHRGQPSRRLKRVMLNDYPKSPDGVQNTSWCSAVSAGRWRPKSRCGGSVRSF